MLNSIVKLAPAPKVRPLPPLTAPAPSQIEAKRSAVLEVIVNELFAIAIVVAAPSAEHSGAVEEEPLPPPGMSGRGAMITPRGTVQSGAAEVLCGSSYVNPFRTM